MENEEITKEEIAHNIKNPYITPVAILMNIMCLIFYTIMFFNSHLLYKLPKYIYIFLAFWAVINIISYVQEKSKKVKTNQSSLIRYIIISTLCGYSLSIALASIYVFNATINGDDVFEFWLMIVLANVIELIGFNIFVISEFEVIKAISNRLFKLLGILMAVSGLGMLYYISQIAPKRTDDTTYIWLSIIVILMINLLIGRSYFNLMRYQIIEEEGLE